MSVLTKDMDYYLSLNYRIELERDEEGDYIATIPLLPGCMADGKTPSEAVANLETAKREWIAASLESALSVPEPHTKSSERKIRDLK